MKLLGNVGVTVLMLEFNEGVIEDIVFIPLLGVNDG